MRIFLVVAFLLVAGCSGSTPSTAPTEPGTNATDPVSGAPVILGFNWSITQAWEHIFTIGNETDAEPMPYTAVVVGLVDDGWSVQGSTEESAITNAAFFLGTLGEMGTDGTMKHQDFEFPFYRFPLADNKTWTASETNVGGATFETTTQELTMTARWDAAAPDGGAYAIEARQADGSMRARYDFVPATGWFSSYETYSDGQTYRVVAKPTAPFTGPAFDATGNVLYSSETINSGPPTAPAGPNAGQFTMNADMTHLVFLQFAYGVPGVAATRIVAPDGTSYGTTSAYDPDGNAVHEDFAQIYGLVDAQEGTWNVAYEATGVFVAHAAVWANGITLIPFAGSASVV